MSTTNMQEGEFSYYAVRRGRHPGIYMTRRDCQQQVDRFSGSDHMGFHELREAITWMRGAVKVGERMEDRSGDSLCWRLQKVVADAGYGTDSRGGMCESSHDDLMTTLTGEERVTRSQAGQFIITENMEVYLVRACTKLQVGTLSFTRREWYTVDGHHLVAFFAVLQCKEKNIQLDVAGTFFMDDFLAREDAAYRLLESLLDRTGACISDFNYRALCSARQKLREYEREMATPLVQRLRDVERERDYLKTKLENFHQLFED
ncbi:hypothetical protein PIB30_084016 [Stylosanthes scabra]|uniref:Ribonuclease H1 N-terminal domain-containing protein n=1 Tax=Stylosanthes scabra TaxID=79078 RepID=A0ABU6WU23_9FABA|nr:hypothetical protein [Stylosanthes scabra]